MPPAMRAPAFHGIAGEFVRLPTRGRPITQWNASETGSRPAIDWGWAIEALEGAKKGKNGGKVVLVAESVRLELPSQSKRPSHSLVQQTAEVCLIRLRSHAMTTVRPGAEPAADAAQTEIAAKYLLQRKQFTKVVAHVCEGRRG